MARYIGFSTVANGNRKKFTLTDNTLIKQDLLNAFNTRLGSMVMQPSAGCIVWDSLHEQITDSLKNDIIQNITSIVNADARINLQNISISNTLNSITITLVILYIATNQLETLIVNFDSNATNARYF